MEEQSSLLETKKHFEVLDGLRGTASVSIVFFHFMEMVFTDYSKSPIGHGFLAVDFFFCLSGFVIGYAYDDRIRKIGIWSFFKARLIRLHPLVILGSVIGLLGFLLDPFGGNPSLYSAGKLFAMFVCSILLLPYPVVEERGFALFAFNSPSWSLFYEYVANIFYAIALSRIGKSLLILLTLAAAGWLAYAGHQAGTLIGGWDGKSAWDGAARIAYSFLAGLLVYRMGWIFKTRLGFAALSLLLLLSFTMPYWTWNWLAETLVVLFFFPLVIALGAGADLPGHWRKLCVFLGRLSYPLYMTHIVGIWSFGHYYDHHHPDKPLMYTIVVLTMIVMISFAYVAMVFYDTPIRNYLNRKRRAFPARRS